MTDLGGEPGGHPPTAADAIAERAADLATEVTEADRQADRRRLAAAFAAAAHSGARMTGRGVRAARRGMGAGTGWLAAQVVAMAPRLRVRDQEALRAQFPGLLAEEIADALIEGAARASACALRASPSAAAIFRGPTKKRRTPGERVRRVAPWDGAWRNPVVAARSPLPAVRRHPPEYMDRYPLRRSNGRQNPLLIPCVAIVRKAMMR